MIGFLILLSKKMKEKLPAAPHKLFWNFREAVDCCPWRVFLVWGTTVFFFIFERHAFRAVIFLVSVLDSEKKTESPTTTTTTTTCPKRMNEKGIIDCPWLMIFSNYFEKDEELAAAVVIHFKWQNFGKWFFVCLVSHVSLIVWFGKTMQEEEGKVFKCFHFDWPRGEVGGGGTKLVHSTPSIIQGTFVNDRGENVWNLFQHNKKKGGQICLVVEFRKNFETKKYVDFGIMQRIHFSAWICGQKNAKLLVVGGAMGQDGGEGYWVVGRGGAC